MSCNTRVFCTDLDHEFVVATNAFANCKFAQKEQKITARNMISSAEGEKTNSRGCY